MADGATFKPGDRVVCDDASGSLDRLAEFSAYTVETVNGSGCVTLEGVGAQWDVDRFRLISRPSQPSDERDGPKVGETWEVRRGPHGTAKDVLTERRLMRGTGAPYWVAKSGDSFFEGAPEKEWRLIRRLSAPSADKWEPKPGERVEWDWEGKTYTGIYKSTEANGHRRIYADVGFGAHDGFYTDDVVIRPATPSPKATDVFRLDGKETCADCGKPIENPVEACIRYRRGMGGEIERLPGTFHIKCGPTGPVAKPDPYAAHRRKLSQEAMPPGPDPFKLDQRIAAAKAQYSADLDRGSRERLVALGGRYGKRVPVENRNWPEAEED